MKHTNLHLLSEHIEIERIQIISYTSDLIIKYINKSKSVDKIYHANKKLILFLIIAPNLNNLYFQWIQRRRSVAVTRQRLFGVSHRQQFINRLKGEFYSVSIITFTNADRAAMSSTYRFNTLSVFLAHTMRIIFFQVPGSTTYKRININDILLK